MPPTVRTLQVEGVAGGVALPVDTELPAAAVLTDVNANPTTPMVGAGLLIWNGATWEREIRPSADAITAVGLPGYIPMIINGAGTYDRAREPTGDNQFPTGYLGSALALFNGAGWDRARAAQGDGSAAAGFLNNAGMLYNGATYDRWRAGALLGSASVDVSDRVARALGVIASITAAVDVSDRAARALGVVASITAPVELAPSTLWANTPGGANAAATLTLPAAGAGLFHYIDYLRLVRIATAAVVGSAILTVTTTNLNGRTFRTGNLIAAGDTEFDFDHNYTRPVKSAVANTASTIVAPAAGAAVSWDLYVEYHTGT